MTKIPATSEYQLAKNAEVAQIGQITITLFSLSPNHSPPCTVARYC